MQRWGNTVFYKKDGIISEVGNDLDYAVKAFARNIIKEFNPSPQELGAMGFIFVDAIISAIHEESVRNRLSDK